MKLGLILEVVKVRTAVKVRTLKTRQRNKDGNEADQVEGENHDETRNER